LLADNRVAGGSSANRWVGLFRAEAELLLRELDKPGPVIISITAPPGCGKSALFHLAVEKRSSATRHGALSEVGYPRRFLLQPGVEQPNTREIAPAA
jgi:hypothetical protein